MSLPTIRTVGAVVAGAVVICAVAASPLGDEGWGFPVVILLGPVMSGAVAAHLGRP